MNGRQRLLLEEGVVQKQSTGSAFKPGQPNRDNELKKSIAFFPLRFYLAEILQFFPLGNQGKKFSLYNSCVFHTLRILNPIKISRE